MEAVSKLRLSAVSAIRERVASCIGSWLADKECVQIALCCATREPGPLLEFLFNRDVEKAAKLEISKLAVTAIEFEALFGAKARATREGTIASVMSDGDFQECVHRLENALRCTLHETIQGGLWSRPWTKVSTHYAMHLDSHEDGIAVTLGSVVRADARRLDDLRADLDDAGVDEMLMSRVIVALSETTT